MLDSTVVNVALPAVGADLGASLGGLQWVVNGYTLSLAALILLGDRCGPTTRWPPSSWSQRSATYPSPQTRQRRRLSTDWARCSEPPASPG